MKKSNVKFLLLFLLSIAVFAYFVFGFNVYVKSPTGSNVNLSGNILLNASVDDNATNVTFYFYHAGNGTLAYANTTLNLSIDDFDYNVTINTAALFADGIYNLIVNAT